MKSIIPLLIDDPATLGISPEMQAFFRYGWGHSNAISTALFGEQLTPDEMLAIFNQRHQTAITMQEVRETITMLQEREAD